MFSKIGLSYIIYTIEIQSFYFMENKQTPFMIEEYSLLK